MKLHWFVFHPNETSPMQYMNHNLQHMCFTGEFKGSLCTNFLGPLFGFTQLPDAVYLGSESCFHLTKVEYITLVFT